MLFLFLISSVLPFFVTAECPGITFLSQCYVFNNVSSQYISAELACNNLGGHLTSIHDGLENTFLAQEANATFFDLKIPDFWTGASDMITPGNWSWMDGTSWDYTNWREQPFQQKSGQSCGSVVVASGLWNSDDCYKSKTFVCKINPATTTTSLKYVSSTNIATTVLPSAAPSQAYSPFHATTTSEGIVEACPDGWSYFAITQSCYFLLDWRNTGRWYSWVQSEQYCTNHSSHLASIHSQEELTFVNSLYSGWKWIGLYHNYSDTEWKWTDGTPFDYVKWFDNYPMLTDHFMNCGILTTGFANSNSGDGRDAYKSVCKRLAYNFSEEFPTPSEGPTLAPSLECGEHWKYFYLTNSCFLYAPAFEWYDGEDYCVSVGGHLASYHSYAESQFIDSLGFYLKWTGLYTNDAISDNTTTWLWSDGSSANYQGWGNGGYADPGKGLCGMFWGWLMNWPCTQTIPTVCKKHSSSSIPNSADICPTTSWTYYQETNSCYSFSPKLSWSEAEEYCVNQSSSHLASIHSTTELNFITSSLIQDQNWIGLYAINNLTLWQWTDNSSLNYTRWAFGNPTTYQNPCMTARSEGFGNWNDCDTPFVGICKKPII